MVKKKQTKKKLLKQARGTVSRQLAELERKLAEREGRISALAAQIGHLEGLVAAHDRLEELARQELIDADQTIRAQENLQDMIARERQEADATIRAQQLVGELSDLEKREADATIRAQERLLHLSDMEKKDAVETIRAHEALEELVRREKVESDRFFTASREVSALSARELQSRDSVLRQLLTLNRAVSGLFKREELLGLCLNGIVGLLEAEHGIVFGSSSSRPVALALCRLEAAALDQPAWIEVVRRVRLMTRESGIVVNCDTGREGKRTVLLAPLVHNGCLSGVLCLVRSGAGEGFSRFAQEAAELFAGQMAIYLNNVALFTRVREQNGQLLRLINLKDSFIRRVSEELVPRLAAPTGPEFERFRTMVERVLSITALEEEVDSLFRDTVDFREVLATVAARHTARRSERGITVTVELDPAFHAYQANLTLITTIVDELYSNAVFYNREGGWVRITGRLAGEYLELEFEDSGPGIPAEERERVFGQFFRLPEGQASNEFGAGLGLFMVRTCVAGYGGQVLLQSAPGGGCLFRVTLLAHA